MRILLELFSGERPRMHKQKLRPEEAQIARNTKLWSGALKPFRGLLEHATPSKAGAGTVKSIYRWGATPGNVNSGFWFNWLTDVDVIRGPVQGDTVERTYFTGDGAPKMTYSPIATGGADYPNASYLLGIPAPTGAPTLQVNGSAGQPEDAVTRYYAVTFVSELGEEGPPLIFGPCTWYPTNTVSVAALPTSGPIGAYNITNKRLYRTATGAQGTGYYFLAELTLADPDYTDSLDDANLAETLPSLNWSPPPSDMIGINAMPNGICYGFSKNQVCVSEPYLPHAWNPLNRYTTNYPIIGGGHYDQTIVAVTTRNPHVISGINPDSIDGVELQIGHGCVSKRSVLTASWGVGYASERGYVIINSAGPQVISEQFFTEDEWAALVPSSMVALNYNNRVLLLYDNGTAGALLFDPDVAGSGVIRLDLDAEGGYFDPLTKELFLLVDNKIQRWDDGTLLTYLWRSKEIVMPSTMSFSAMKVYADSYNDLYVRLYVDGETVFDRQVYDEGPVRLQAKYHGRKFEIEVEGTDTVSKIVLAEAVSEFSEAA